MPGYETYKFVGLSEDEKTELTCSICQDIFKCPIFTKCCLQTFCEDCINDWLETNNTCPYDRKPLTKCALTRPPRVFMNILGKLKIRCDFSERGCNEVLFLENLTQHSLSCHYNFENWKKCEKCLCDWFVKSNHDCIKSLLELNKKANEETNAWRNKYESSAATNDDQNISAPVVDSLKREIKELKSERVELLKKLDDSDLEKANLLRTIQELTNTPNFNTNAITIAQLKFETLRPKFLSGKIYWKIITDNTDMRGTMIASLKQILFEAIKKIESLYNISDNICKQMDKKYGDGWQCFIYHKDCATYNIKYANQKLIRLQLGDLNFIVFQENKGSCT